MVAKSIYKSDILGAAASGLCVIHCLATPLLFAVQSCSSSCCGSSPTWWSSIDYVFIFVTFFAVFQSSKNTNKYWMKYILLANWILLSFLVINQKMVFFNLAEYWKHLSAFAMIALHLYNLKYCKCAKESCCLNS